MITRLKRFCRSILGLHNCSNQSYSFFSIICTFYLVASNCYAKCMRKNRSCKSDYNNELIFSEDICRLKWQGVKTAYQERLLKLTDDSNPKHKFDINSNNVTKNTDKQFTTSPADILSNDKSPNSNIEIDESDTAAHALYSELFDQKCFSLNDLNADDVSRTEVVESCSDVGSCSSRKRKISDEQDADDAFLCSLLPDLKRMNHRQKNRFKRNVLELIDDVLYASP